MIQWCVDTFVLDLLIKSLLDYTNLLSLNENKNNDKIILKGFKSNLNKLKCIIIFAINVENLKKLNYHIFLKIILSLSVV